MTLMREIAMLVYEWLTGQIILGGTWIILTGIPIIVPIIGRERAGRWIVRWVRLWTTTRRPLHE